MGKKTVQGMKWASTAIGRVAHLTHFIPEGPRRRVRDWMVERLNAGLEKPYRPPLAWEPGRYPAGINEFGFFREETGLGQGARMYARSIEAAGIPHRFIHTDWLEWLPKDDDSFADRLSKRPRYEVNLIHINPDLWNEACREYPHRCFDRRYNIGVWLWELERLPAAWLPWLDYVNELWVPSAFIRDAVRAVSDKPVTVIPYAIETRAEPLGRKELGLPEQGMLVLTMFDSQSYAIRKNPGAAVRAFTEAFSGSGDAHLVLKINHPHREDIEQLERQLKEARVSYTLTTERLPRERLNALIAACDVFVSLHRSEGFGLPIAEAMSLGRAVVATNWSANAEFMSPETACPVDCTMIPVGEGYPFPEEGQRWAEPDIGQAARYLRRLRDEPEYREAIGRAAQAFIREQLSAERCGRLMKERLAEIAAGGAPGNGSGRGD